MVKNAVCQYVGLGIRVGWAPSLVLLVFLAGASIAVAQLDTGTISGTVTDQSGAAVPGATITVRNAATGVSRGVQTDARGRYEAAALPAGSYEVNAALSGFQTSIRTGIELTVGRNAVVNMVLQVGEVTQVITVTGEASFVETTTATVTNLVDEKRVMDIPLNNRDLTYLAFSQPGVLRIPQSAGGSRTELGMGEKLSVAGGRGNQNVYLLDGVSNGDISGSAQTASRAYTGAETVQEFQVITNNYSAEYPSKPGAVVSAVTKSGTNSLHGSLFEFLRNDNLDAAAWLDTATAKKDGTPVVKPEFKRNHFGGSVGGPIIRDKTFFFGSYEGTRERLTKTTTVGVPSLSSRTGPVDPAVAPFLAVFPVPGQVSPLTGVPTTFVSNNNDGTAVVTSPQNEPTNENFAAGKMDHHFADQKKGFLSLTYNVDYANYRIFGVLPSGNSVGNRSTKHVVAARHTSILSPVTLNEFVFGFSRTIPSGDDPSYQIDWSNVDGKDLRFHPERKFMGELRPGQNIDNIGNPRERSDWGQDLYTIKDSLSLTRVNHAMKMGAEINRMRHVFHTTSGSYNGTYIFSDLSHFLQNKPQRLDFDLPSGMTVLDVLTVQEQKDFDVHQSVWGFYFQDNYKMLSSLTLNLGLRYEFMTLPKEATGNLWALRNFTDTVTTKGDLFKNATKKSFSPRFGFAWSPGSHQTVVRGGFGIYFEHPTLYKWTTLIGEMVPVNVAGSYRDRNEAGFAADPTNGLRFPDGPTTQVAKLAQAPNQRTAEYSLKPLYVSRWSLNLERQVGSWLFSAGYSGARGYHNWVQSDGNMYKWIGWPNNVPSDQKHWVPGTHPDSDKINPKFSNIWVESANSNNFYHGLVANVSKRMSAGLQLQAAYTFSKAIDDGSGSTNSEGGLPQNQRVSYYWDPGMRRGLSQLDIRNNLVSQATYELPQTGMQGVGGVILNGWQINGVLTLSDGHPFTVTDSSSAQSDAMRVSTGLRPNLIPNGNNNPVIEGQDRSVPLWAYYDVNQFIPSTCRGGVMCARNDAANGYLAGYFGNLGRNTLIGPGLATLDFSLNKNFPVTEGQRVQFRMEFFNLFNRANFRIPQSSPFNSNGTRNSAAGQINDTRTSQREMQFGLKYIF